MSEQGTMNEAGVAAPELIKQGAEARIFTSSFYGQPCIIKERFPKTYRHPVLDRSLTAQRTKSEVRAMMRCRMNGIQTPAIYFVDLVAFKIYMEHIVDGITVRDHIKATQLSHPDTFTEILTPLAHKIGESLHIMHQKNIIHGDLTTSNMLLRQPSQEKLDLILIDFGLGYVESVAEDKGVDLYVLERAFLSTHPNTEALFQVILDTYIKKSGKASVEVINKLDEIRLRGRKRTMVG